MSIFEIIYLTGQVFVLNLIYYRNKYMNNDSIDIDRIKKGIACYSREQAVLMRLISKSNGLSESKFDKLFMSREYRGRRACRATSGLLLGMGENCGKNWAFYLA